MSESLLAAAQEGTARGAIRGAVAGTAVVNPLAVLPRPTEVPEKFWDNENGALRVMRY